MAWHVKGTYIETCSCDFFCPCNFSLANGADYDYCRVALVFNVTEGDVDGTDVGGLAVAAIADTPKVMTDGNWRLGLFIDEAASEEQAQKLAGVFSGQLGGPLADLAQLVSEVVGVYDVPIDFNMQEGKGTIRVGDAASADMQPYTDAQGRPTKLVDTVFSTIPGSPAYAGKASSFKVNVPQHQMQWEYNGRNAILGDFRMEG